MDRKTEADHLGETRARLLEAMQGHVAFDGWTDAAFDAAVADAGIDPALARAAAPRKGLDMAVAAHKAGDAEMAEKLAEEDLSALKFRERIIRAVRIRIEIAARDREGLRRAVTLFALPIHAAEGARLIWGTADLIWTTLGDTSRDYNWYSKRAILSGVYSSTLLYRLGDDSEGAVATWNFLDRRIEDVMQFEKVKAQLRDNRLAQFLLAGPKAALSVVRAPAQPPGGLPGGRG